MAASQSTLCCDFHACTAMPFFVSFLLTTPLCSLSLFSSVLLVSPMYAQLHSAQGTWYITPFFFHVCGAFVYTRASRRVPLDLKVVLIPNGLYTHSFNPLTDSSDTGRCRNLGVTWSWSRGVVIVLAGS